MEQTQNNLDKGSKCTCNCECNSVKAKKSQNNQYFDQQREVAAVASGFPVTASSEYNPDHSIHRCMINQSRVRQGAAAWQAGFNEIGQWIQVCLMTPRYVTSVSIQGRQNKEQWVTKFKIMYSVDGVQWQYHENGREFAGSVDQFTIVHHKFEDFFLARTVRILPTEWKEEMSMKFEVYFLSE
ncbi:galactose-binding domain-containing protein [Stylonychia lemnae]|uniref:Galactose-binding domain-containing protein n=1 Tax=Stylonychia lemnae TaxID=5949 RepID=A0A078AD87_STYLE|nr:galactose-binding domain-containing protein [Stylonychia lemnae]|eukprot:CDW78828.1 galactose-binding domain-containing protein [Stylonychia lemnae]